jgi:probable F420-dependent oxidoreductase
MPLWLSAGAIPTPHPVAAMRDYLDAMSHADWRGPAAPLPPIVLAALGPRIVSLARDRTAGDYTYFTTAEHMREVRDAMGQEHFLAADLPIVLAGSRAMARKIGHRHTTLYLSTANYRNNLLRMGWVKDDLEPPGSDRLFDVIVAWGDVGSIGDRAEALFAAGADQVVFNVITAEPATPYIAELRKLSAVTS